MGLGSPWLPKSTVCHGLHLIQPRVKTLEGTLECHMMIIKWWWELHFAIIDISTFLYFACSSKLSSKWYGRKYQRRPNCTLLESWVMILSQFFFFFSRDYTAFDHSLLACRKSESSPEATGMTFKKLDCVSKRWSTQQMLGLQAGKLNSFVNPSWECFCTKCDLYKNLLSSE